MQEQLVGYLLDALEPDELRSIEQLLASDAEARRQLEILRDALLPLAGGGGFVEAPSGLVARTFARVRLTQEREATDSPDRDDEQREPR